MISYADKAVQDSRRANSQSVATSSNISSNILGLASSYRNRNEEDQQLDDLENHIDHLIDEMDKDLKHD